MSLTWPVTPLTGSILSEWCSCDAEFHPGSDYFHVQIRAFWGCQHDWHFHSWGQGSSMSQQARGQPVSSGTSVCSCSWVQRIPSHPSWDAGLGRNHFFFKFLLEYNCFTMLCYFLLYSQVSQLYIYIYLLFLKFSYHLGQHRALSRVPCYTVDSH